MKKGRIDHWTQPKRLAATRAYVSTVALRTRTPDAKWAKELDRFITQIRDMILGRAPITMEKPEVIPQFKETDGDMVICRPICVYRDLTTKVLLALTCKYIVSTFDPFFHRNMLFMRGPRRSPDGRWFVPNYLDAIRLTAAFRRKAGNSILFVGECDIKKFYDILNHEDILRCFDSLCETVADLRGLGPDFFRPVRRILEAYLDSYDYWHDVMSLNDQSNSIWKKMKKSCATRAVPDPECRFKWVSDADFIGSGCYTAEELADAKGRGLIGVPQGGALSGIIVNIVMQSVDVDIVSGRDRERLFIRYCDDILLMHTDRDRCREYLDIYCNALREHKLVPHERHDVKEFKNGVKTGSSFWHAKTKNVFKWGEGGGDASDWIAFVGYEMRRTGEVRFRKDKIDKEFKTIAKTYYRVIKGKETDPVDRLKNFSKLPKNLFCNDEVKTDDRYTLAQARRLDHYLLRKYYQAARKLGLNTEELEDPTTFFDVLGQ